MTHQGRIALLLLLATAIASPAMGQSLTGSIAGVVRDAQGGVLPGANVTLSGRMGDRNEITDPQGEYRFLGLDPGTYSVQGELAGFRTARQDNLVITAGRNLDIDLTLAVGGVEEEVQVFAESPVVDVKSSATETSISQDLLFSAPITRTAINVLNYAPGINSSSAYGGESDSGNALLIDGVDTRDPSGGTPWTFYNYNIVEEMQFQGLGAPAEYGGFTGAVVNTITKSGGNRFTGLFEILGTNSGLASSNIDDEIIADNPALAQASKTTKYIDITTQMGGPLIQNKAFFFVSAQRFELEVDPSGPITRRHEVSPRVNMKFTFQPSDNDNFTTHLQYDAYNIIGRAGVSALAATDDLTNREDAPEWVWLLQWRHIFGASTFAEVKYTGWTGFYDLNPEVNLPGRFDGATGLTSVSQGWYYYADRGRHQVNASVSHYAQAWGNHEFKFGAEIEASKTRDRYGYTDDIFFYDYGGVPYYAYSYSYDITAKNRRQTMFAQDSWKVGDRLTLNLGVRGDYIQGRHDELGTVFNTKSWAPRLGVAWDMRGDYSTVVKGSYGWYYEGAQTAAFTRAVPGVSDYVGYFVLPDGSLEEWFVEESVPYRVRENLKHPRVDELTVGFERAIRGDMRLAVTGIWRENKNFIGSVSPSARFTPVTVTNSITGQPMTIYEWANRSSSDTGFVLRNVEGFQYRTPSGEIIGTLDPYREYRALMFVLTKRLSNRWTAQTSYVLSKAEGNVDNTSGQQIGSSIYEHPNRSLVNTDGNLTNDRTHEFKLLGSYQVPVVDVALNAYFRIISGRNYAPFEQFSNALLDSPTAARQPLLETRGARRLPTTKQLDLRLEKVFNVAATNRIGLYMEIENVFNSATITGVATRVPSTDITVGPGETATIFFEAPSAVSPPRQIRLGARWSF